MTARRVGPQRATVLLAAGLAVLTAGLAAGGPATPLLTGRPLPDLEVLAGLTTLFCLAELCLLHVEVRREAYSVTLAGLPLALGLLLCSSRELILARLAGSAVAFAVQRSPGLKTVYNLAAYAAEAALDLTVAHLLLTPTPTLSLPTAATCYLVLAAVDQLMSLLVVQVISWHQGKLSGRQVLAVHLPAAVCSLLATTAAYGGYLLAAHGALGVFVLAVFCVTGALAYRGFQVLHRRHQALEHVHAFVGLNNGAASVEELAGRMLEQARALMRASSAVLLIVEPTSTMQLSVDEAGGLQVTVDGWASTDWLVGRVREHDEPALLSGSTRDRASRAWLAARQVSDAVIVRLPRAAGDGALMIFDRLGDTGSFTGEDKALLQTLAGHLSVAVRSSTLMDRLRYEATHDVLTGLANRALLGEAIRAELDGADRFGAAVLLLDLNRFKEVNDTLGHHVGDALLRVVADRLRTALPAEATVARLGGDEFAALIPRLADPQADAEALARAAATAIRLPVELPEATLTTQASIGVAVAAPDCSASDLLRHADTAMYTAKASNSGRDGCVVPYTAELDRGRAERLALLADMHLALDRAEFEVRYQPKLDLQTDTISSVEALVRWRHPRLGLLGPDTFIPLAEANGLIEPLTAIVLQQALRQCAAWQTAGLDIAVAVNLSARGVNNPDLPAQISDALLHAGIPAHRLILEVTESSVMQDPDRAVTILERIAAIGVTLSLDDFGTGYSSLSYLQRLPVREVKIDRSFITDLTSSSTGSQVLVRSIIQLGIGLGLRVVAEGIEDDQTLHLLRDLGCHLAQGYHISRPIPPEHLTALVRQRDAARQARGQRLHAVTA